MAVEVIVKSIGSAGGRDYATIAAWLAACPADLTTGGADGQGRIWRGELYNDGEITLAAALSLPTVTSSATQYIELTAAAGQSFVDNPTYYNTHALKYDPANGAAIRMGTNGTSGGATLVSGAAYFNASRIQLIMGSIDNNFPIVSLSGGRGKIKQCLLESLSTQPAVLGSGSGAGFDIENSLIIKRRGGAAVQVSSGAAASTYKYVTVFSPTGAGGTNAFVQTYTPGPVIQNCAVFGFNNLYYSSNAVTANASSAGNVTSSTTGIPGVAGGKSGLLATDQFTDVTAPPDNTSTPAYNLMPKSGNALGGAGSVLAGITVDLLGTTRSATAPAAGAIEASAAPVTVVGTMAATLGAAVFTGTGTGYSVGTVGSLSVTLAAATMAATGTGATGATATITTNALASNTGSVLASASGITAHIYEVATGNKVTTITGLSTNASGVLTITSTAITAGVSYRVVVVTGSGEGLQTYTAT